MNDFAQTLVDGLKLHEQTVGSTFTIGGKTFPCCGGEEMTSQILSAGGLSGRADVTIVVRMEELGEQTINTGQPLSYTSADGAKPIGLKVSSSGANTLWGALVVISCNHPAQRG